MSLKKTWGTVQDAFLTHPYWSVFVLGFIVHVLAFWFLNSHGVIEREMTDGSQYMVVADNLLAGRGFSLRTAAPYVPDTIRTPLYPFFLAAAKYLTGSFWPTLVISILFGATIPLAGMLCMRVLSSSKKWVLLAGLLLVFEPHLARASLVFGSESLSLPFAAWAIATGSFALFGGRFKPKIAALSGIFFGLSVLARPITQLVPVLLFVIGVIEYWKNVQDRRVFVRAAGLLLLAYTIVVAPWLWRNYSQFNVVSFSNIGWFNMYTRTAATTLAIHNRTSFDFERRASLERLHELGYVNHTPVEEWDVHGYEFTPILQKETWKVITQYPKELVVSQLGALFSDVSQDLLVVYLRGAALVHYTYPSFAPIYKLSQDGFAATARATWDILSWELAYSMIARVGWLILFVLALSAPWFAWKHQKAVFSPTVFFVLYELYILALSLNGAAESGARYRTQFVFVEIPLALFALSVWYASRRRRA